MTEEVKSGPMGIDYDPAHFALTGRSNTEALRLLHAVTMHVQLRDGFKGFDGGGQEAAVGSGVVDWTELLPTFVEANLQTWVCVERTGGDQRSDDVRDAMERIGQLLPSPG